MRLITFEHLHHPGRRRLGALLDGDTTVLDLTAAAPAPAPFASMRALIDAGADGLDRARQLCERPPGHALSARDGIRLRAPLPDPARLRDCGLFIAHLEAGLRTMARRRAEAADDPAAEFERLMASGTFDLDPLFRERVMYYSSDHLSVSGPEDEIHPPTGARELDYELEFAAVIGRTGRGVPKESAHEHIFGYTVFNDWSARDLQLLLMRSRVGPGEGKDFEGANGLGPCIVTPDELTDPYALTMTARVNGEEWSRGSTAEMHHSFEDAIEQLSRDRAVHAGEVIGSGTVSTGTGLDLGKRLKDGDLVELEIEGIGVLRNPVALPVADDEAGRP